MANRSYINFDLSIERAGEHYRARVLQSCAGEGSVEFELPFTDEGLENFILKMGHARRSPGRRIRGSDSPEMAAAKQFGGKLFGAVFQGDVYACLRASLDEANRQGQGVRVLLRTSPELADIPWEYLYNPAWNVFFTLSAETPVVRYLELTPPIFPLAVRPPLRLLVVIASPADYPQLDVEREWANLQTALGPLTQQGLFEIERLESANLLALQRKLRRGTYHILHFIGHGSFDENAQDGLLLFADEGGRGKPISGQYLGTLLHDHRSLRLAVLNACEGARSGREDPFAGAAQSLVQMGLPAVIAMQFEISDGAAILFAQEFYMALADGYPVDAALADARKAIFASSDREWGTPVLFSRTLDGRIFELTRLAQRKKPAKPKPAAQPVKAAKQKGQPDVDRLYEDGLSAFNLEDWARAEERFRAALEVQPGHTRAAEKLAQVQRQLDLAQRYEEAQQQAAARDWCGALNILEQLEKDVPGYGETANWLEEARKQTRLVELYADAARLRRAEEWQAVVSVFEQIHQLDPDASDPEGLLPAARNGLAQAQRQLDLAERYQGAHQALEARQWADAYQQLSTLAADEPHYRDVSVLLVEARKQAHLAELYADAARLSQAGEWQAVVGAFDEMRQLDPACPDPDGLLPAAQKALSEAERQQKLADLYRQALQALEAQNWPKAQPILEQVQRAQPGYRDTTRLLDKAKTELAHQSAVVAQPSAHPVRPDGKAGAARKSSPWLWLGGGIGGLTVLVVIATIGMLLFRPWEWFNIGKSATQTASAWNYASAVTQQAAATTAAATSTPIITPATPAPSATHIQTPTATHIQTPTATPYPPLITDAKGVQMALIPAGTFQMGSESGGDDERPVHSVTLTQPFYMDIYEVTNAQYAQCVADGVCSKPSENRSYTRSSYYGNAAYDDYPVIYINWSQASEYCAWRGGGLPSEAQWEYAARGGLEGKAYPWGDESPVCDTGVSNGANLYGCAGDTVAVGSYAPNGYGLYDMAGNVWEWVADWYGPYSSVTATDPTGPVNGDYRVLRVGSWVSSGNVLRVAGRIYYDPSVENLIIGFRCVAPAGK